MRIALWYNLSSGGAKRALYDHVKGLVERGHTVEAWRTPAVQTDYLPLGDIINEAVIPLQDTAVSSQNLFGKYWEYARRQERLLAAHDEHARTVAAAIPWDEYDLLLCSTCQHLQVPYLARYSKLPSAIFLHEPSRHLFEAQPQNRWAAPLHPSLMARIQDAVRTRAARIQVREEIASAAAFSKIIVNSTFSRESILRAYGLDSEVCYLGIDTEHFQAKNLPRKQEIISLGSLIPQKNALLAIEAMGCLTIEERPPLIWIANYVDRDYQNACEQVAKRLGVHFEVKTLITDKALIEHLNQAAAMLYTSHLEPFGLAPLEANACGTPVVAVAEGGVRETIEDGTNGYLTSADPKQIAETLLALLRDPTLAAQIGAEAIKLVREKWSLEAALDRFENQLRGLIP